MSDASLHQVWSETELDDALDRLHADPAPTDLGAARAALMRAAGVVPAARPSVKKPHRAWAWVAAAAAVIVLAGAVVAVSNLPGGTSPEPRSQLQVGSTSAIQSDPPLPPGQFRYLYEQRWEPPIHDRRYELIVETWASDDPSQEWLRHETVTRRWLPVPGPDANIATGIPGGGPPDVKETHGRVDAGQGDFTNPTPAFLATLKQDPQWLYARMLAQLGHGPVPANADPDVFIFETIVELLTSGRLPRQYRVLFGRTLALVPGCRTTSDDSRTTYTFERDNRRVVLVLRGDTGDPLTQRITTIDATTYYPAGTPLRESFYKPIISERPPIPTSTTTKPT